MVLWLLSSMLQRGATWTGGIGGRTFVMFRLQNWPVRKPMSLVNPIKEVVNSKVYLCSSCPHWLWICWQTRMIDCSIASTDLEHRTCSRKDFQNSTILVKFIDGPERHRKATLWVYWQPRSIFSEIPLDSGINRPSPDLTKTPMFSSQGLAGPHCQDVETWRSAQTIQAIKTCCKLSSLGWRQLSFFAVVEL